MPTQDNAAQNAGVVTATTTAETAAVTTSPVTFNNPAGLGNFIEGNLVIAVAASATSVAIKVYQGSSIAGTLVASTGNINVVASTTVDLGFAFEDTSAVAKAGQNLQYTVSFTVNGAAANSTIAAGLAVVSVTPVTGAS